MNEMEKGLLESIVAYPIGIWIYASATKDSKRFSFFKTSKPLKRPRTNAAPVIKRREVVEFVPTIVFHLNYL